MSVFDQMFRDAVRRTAAEAGAIMRLAGPLIVSQLSQIGMAFTDTVMAGHLSAEDLAGVAMGTSLWLPVNLACVGILLALSPTVAHLKGAHRLGEAGHWFRQAAWLALIVAVLAVPTVRYIGVVVEWIAVEPRVVPLTQGYLAAVAWGMPGLCLYLLPRFASEGIGHTRPVMYVQLTALAVNVLLDYVLMYGKLGFPAMGAVGAGWATALVMWLTGASMITYVRFHRAYRAMELFDRRIRVDPKALRRLLALGLPIAGTLVMEVGLFSAVTLLMGKLGTIAVAAHQIALNYAALVFMVPLGLSMGITVRVGHAAGAQNAAAARFSGLVGMTMAVGFMLVSAAIMLSVPGVIVGIYTDEPEVIALAVQLLFLAAIFQVSDGLQVSAVGALRGLKDTARPMLIVFVSFWLIGLPLAWALGIAGPYGPRGLWTGLVAGLTAAALLLSWRFYRRSQRRGADSASKRGEKQTEPVGSDWVR